MDALFQTVSATFLDKITYPDISISAGKTTFISGDSGKGKSTLLKMFNGVLSPTTGKVLYKGRDIAGEDAVKLRCDVLLVGQQVFLFDGMTIEENFAEFYDYRGLPAPDKERMKKYMDICAAGFPLDTPCSSLSGGERQRVYNAVFTSFEPPVLMLDEPTAALDEENAVLLLQNIINGCVGSETCNSLTTTLIVVSHDRTLVKTFGDDVITL